MLGNVVEALEGNCARPSFPRAIRADQGTEFDAWNLDLWAYALGLTLDFSRPGKPTESTFFEALNGRFWAEILPANWFLMRTNAAEKLEAVAAAGTRPGPMVPSATSRRSR